MHPNSNNGGENNKRSSKKSNTLFGNPRGTPVFGSGSSIFASPLNPQGHPPSNQQSTNPLALQRILGPPFNEPPPAPDGFSFFNIPPQADSFGSQQSGQLSQLLQTPSSAQFPPNPNANASYQTHLDNFYTQLPPRAALTNPYDDVEPRGDRLKGADVSQQNHAFLEGDTSSTQGLAPAKLKLPFLLKPEHDSRSTPAVPPALKTSSFGNIMRRSSQRIAEQAERKKQAQVQVQAQALAHAQSRSSGQHQGQSSASGGTTQSSSSRPRARRAAPPQTSSSDWFGGRQQTPSDRNAFPKTLAEYGQQIRQKKCPECQSLIIATEKELLSLKECPVGPYQPHPFLVCQKCRMTACMGCGMTVGVSSNLTPPAPKWPAHVSRCDGAWLFIFWLLLSREPNPSTSQADSVKARSANSKSPATMSKTLFQNMSALGKGIGYAGDAQEDLAYAAFGMDAPDDEDILEYTINHNGGLMNAISPPIASPWPNMDPSANTRPRRPLKVDSVQQGMKLKRAEQAKKDERVSSVLSRANVLLQSTGRYPPIISQMFLRSRVMQEVAEMLRNDSLEDMASRHGAYCVVLRFIRRLQSQEDLKCLVYADRPGLKHHQDLFHATFFPINEVVPKDYVPMQPLLASLQDLVKPAQQMHGFIQANQRIFQGQEAADFFNVCESIKQTAMRASSRGVSASDADGEPDVTMTNAAVSEDQKLSEMSAWHKKHAVAEVDDALLCSLHALGNEASQMGASASAPGRMKRLMSELTALATSLPDGIYMRHGSSRLDVMKVIITGPRDTPYENGLFEFDLLCPGNYPKAPPKVKFRTTGGGIRFNPNLYPDGKVCLSLLGTWAGEAWRPEASTILQVLVSIQSMILCQEPWYNEPGRELQKEPERSQHYNSTVQSWTIKIAIEPWLQQGDNKIWGELVDRHFRASADTIVATATQWMQEKTQRPKFNGMMYGRASSWSVEDLSKLLKAYCSGQDVTLKPPAIWAHLRTKSLELGEA